MNDLSHIKVADAFKHLDPNAGLADGLSAGFASLRYKGKMWNLNVGGTSYPIKDAAGYNLPYVDFVILDVNPKVSKIYFGTWNDDNASGPICASVNGDVPDPGVAIPQSKSCGTCEQNEWYSKPNGQRTQNCQSHKRMAILLMPDMTKKLLPAPLLEPVYFKIPPGSFKTLKVFDDKIRHAGLPFSSFITRVSFVEGQQFEMKFEVLQGLTNAEAPLVLPMKESSQTKAITGGMTSSARQIAAPATPKAPERIETGLLSAFGSGGAASPAYAGAQEATSQPAKTRAPRAKKAETIEQAAPPPPQEDTGELPFEESDDDLDGAVARLMGDKMQNMLK